MFEKMYIFATEENLDMVVCGVDMFDSTGTIKSFLFDNGLDISDAAIHVYQCYCSRIIRSNFWKENNLKFWNKKFEDVHLYSQYFNIINNYGYLNLPLYHYRRGHKSISGQRVSVNWLDFLLAEFYIYEKLPSQSFLAAILNDLSLQFLNSIKGNYFRGYLYSYLRVFTNVQPKLYAEACRKLSISKRFICFLSVLLLRIFRIKEIDSGELNIKVNNSKMKCISIKKVF